MDVTVAVGTRFVLLVPVLEAVIVEAVLTFRVQGHSRSIFEAFAAHLALRIALEDARVLTALNTLVVELRRQLLVIVEA